MNILIAEDEAVSRKLLENTLRRLGHEVVAVTNGADAIEELLRPEAPRLAILDWMMPEVDGLTVCRTLRERPEGPYVYIILLTALEGRDNVVEALDAGADDFVVKPFDTVELRARVRAGERVIELQNRLLEAQEALRRQATQDALTGVWNRRVILDQLRRELRRARHERRPVSVILLDVDHFKRINDELGHIAGDEVLREIATRMMSTVRDYDFVGRYGGEEFLVVLPGCDGTLGKVVAERIRARIADQPITLSDHSRTVTASLGIAWTRGGEEEPAVLVQMADMALYRAKAAGRNRVEDGGER